MRSWRCDYCNERTKGCTGLCRTCRSALHHAWKRVKKEGLLVDLAGGSWWVWDPKGEVLVIGKSTKLKALMALILGDPDVTEDEAGGNEEDEPFEITPFTLGRVILPDGLD